MAIHAEYETETGNIIRIVNDGVPKPGEPVSMFTGTPPSTTATKVWLPVRVELPEDFLPRFPRLLGNMNYEKVPGLDEVRVFYPSSNFAIAAVRDALKDEVRKSATYALGRTDWYFIRRLETGEEVPQGVLDERAAVRQRVTEMDTTIDTANPADLPLLSTAVFLPDGSLPVQPAYGVPNNDSNPPPQPPPVATTNY